MRRDVNLGSHGPLSAERSDILLLVTLPTYEVWRSNDQFENCSISKMFVFGLVMIVLSAELGLSEWRGCANQPWIRRPASDHYYQFNDDETSWVLARERCLFQNADLVTIDDGEEMLWVTSHYPVFAAHGKERHVLVGLTNHPLQGWTWLANQKTLDPTVTPWKSGEPFDHAGGLENCAYWNVKAAQMLDLTCNPRILPTLNTRYICERTIEQHERTIDDSDVRRLLKEFKKPQSPLIELLLKKSNFGAFSRRFRRVRPKVKSEAETLQLQQEPSDASEYGSGEGSAEEPTSGEGGFD